MHTCYYVVGFQPLEENLRAGLLIQLGAGVHSKRDSLCNIGGIDFGTRLPGSKA